MDGESIFNVISKGSTVAMLLKLKEAGTPLIMKDFSEILGNYQSRKLRAIELEEDGLIDMRVVMNPKKTTSLSLTEKGEQVASILWMIESIIPGETMLEKSICGEYAETVLRVVRMEGSCNQRKLREYIPNYINLMKAIEALQNDGLLEMNMETTGYRSKKYTLTKFGGMAAEGFANIDKILREMNPAPESR